MKPSFYHQGHNVRVAKLLKKHLNSSKTFLSQQTAGSTRAVGDAMESMVADRLCDFLGEWCEEYSRDFGRRALEDVAFTDVEGFYSAIDVKTHRIDTSFNRPNLISVERLARFYESDANVFSVIMITYSIKGVDLEVSEVMFVPIEFIDWDCLTVGSLGWGQIQILDSKNIRLAERKSRKEWMLRLCDVMLEFYPREAGKVRERIQRFEQVNEYWRRK